MVNQTYDKHDGHDNDDDDLDDGVYVDVVLKLKWRIRRHRWKSMTRHIINTTMLLAMNIRGDKDVVVEM